MARSSDAYLTVLAMRTIFGAIKAGEMPPLRGRRTAGDARMIRDHLGCTYFELELTFGGFQQLLQSSIKWQRTIDQTGLFEDFTWLNTVGQRKLIDAIWGGSKEATAALAKENFKVRFDWGGDGSIAIGRYFDEEME